jgi:hypothetical protein
MMTAKRTGNAPIGLRSGCLFFENTQRTCGEPRRGSAERRGSHGRQPRGSVYGGG